MKNTYTQVAWNNHISYRNQLNSYKGLVEKLMLWSQLKKLHSAEIYEIETHTKRNYNKRTKNPMKQLK